MGGVDSKLVVCSDYRTSGAIDDTITAYIKFGLIPEADEMLGYGWFWFSIYIWNLNVLAYISKIESIAECGILNEVEDAKYG